GRGCRKATFQKDRLPFTSPRLSTGAVSEWAGHLCPRIVPVRRPDGIFGPMGEQSGRKSGVNVTALLLAWSAGDQTALDQLLPVVHGELNRIARRYMRRERHGHTLQP